MTTFGVAHWSSGNGIMSLVRIIMNVIISCTYFNLYAQSSYKKLMVGCKNIGILRKIRNDKIGKREEVGEGGRKKKK